MEVPRIFSKKQTLRFNFHSMIRPFTHECGVRILLDKQAIQFQYTSSTLRMKTTHSITKKLDNDCTVGMTAHEYDKSTFSALVEYNSSIIFKLNLMEFISMKGIVRSLCLNFSQEVGLGKNLLKAVSSQLTRQFQQDTIALSGPL